MKKISAVIFMFILFSRTQLCFSQITPTKMSLSELGVLLNEIYDASKEISSKTSMTKIPKGPYETSQEYLLRLREMQNQLITEKLNSYPAEIIIRSRYSVNYNADREIAKLIIEKIPIDRQWLSGYFSLVQPLEFDFDISRVIAEKDDIANAASSGTCPVYLHYVLTYITQGNGHYLPHAYLSKIEWQLPHPLTWEQQKP